MLREILLFLSEREMVKRSLTRLPVVRSVVDRFVAGTTLQEALSVTRRLNAAEFTVTLDVLGESVEDREAAREAASSYIRCLETVAEDSAAATLSLKLTQLGLDIDRDLCFRNYREVVRRAHELGNFVRIDMEGSDYTEATLDVFEAVDRDFSNTGVVIQSYLRRSEEDVRALVRRGASVRLVKGAYQEPPDVAFQSKDEVDANFVRLMKLLLDGGVPTAIATHDERMIDATLAHAERRDIPDGAFEFQMLYGVRREYQRDLRDRGYGMRIYVPFGSEWYEYFMRRMAERPANLWFVARAMLGS